MDRRADFVLREQLCFALHAASRAITGCYRPLLDEIGLSYTQYTVMLVLWEHRKVTLGFLGDQLHLDSGTLSPMLKRLEARGLLTRVRRPEDERTIEITITSEGEALCAPASAVQEVVEDATGLRRPDLESLRDELVALTARLRSRTERPDAADEVMGRSDGV